MIFTCLSRITRHVDSVFRKSSSTVIFLLLLFLQTLSIQAREVSPEEALSVARRYVRVSEQTQHEVRMRTKALLQSTPYYIYNDAGGNGFVIVASNDAMGEVLAYSTSGAIDTARLNPEVRFLLQSYRDVYRQLKNNPQLTTQAPHVPKPADAVPPLIKSRWGQSEPYNKLTHYYTGCVATAMAQIMYYHQWPLRGQGSNSYTVNYEGQTRSADFSQSQYAWEQMRPTYTYGSYTTQQEDAVAKLMSDVGISVYMQYTPNSSSAQNFAAAQAFRSYFNYDAAIVTKENEGNAHFLEVIQDELRKGFPLYISGNQRSGASGHAWVADGFDREGLIHMNFGWDGQADGYYSLAALNLSSSGTEFGGRPLSFNKQLLVILARPNKPDVPKIEESLREDAPNLAFNIGGEMHFLGAAPQKATSDVKIAYSSFINQSSLPFVGDIGIGIYGEDGSLVRACPSAHHSTGGYTAFRFQQNEGKMPSSGLIAEDVVFSTDLSGLPNGVYTLLPIAAARKGTDEWGAWMKFKKAPRFVLEVQNDSISVREKPSQEAAFQLMAEPEFKTTLRPGEPNSVRLAIRKLNALPFDGQVKLELLNEEGTPIAETLTEAVVDFEMFATTFVKIPLRLPAEVAPGRYRLRLTIIKEYTNEECLVQNINRQQASFVEVVGKEVSSDIFAKANGFAQDDYGSSMPSEEIDVSYTRLFKLGCIAYLNKDKEYEGKLTLHLVDTETERHFPLASSTQTVHLAGEDSITTILSGWLKAKDLKIINHRNYRLALMGEINGEEKDLWPLSIDPYYVSIVNGPYNSYPDDILTGLTDASTHSSMRSGNGLWEVEQEGLQSVEVYALNGALLLRASSSNQPRLVLALPQTPCVVRVTTLYGTIQKFYCPLKQIFHNKN